MPFEHGFRIEVELLNIYSRKVELLTKSASCKEYIVRYRALLRIFKRIPYIKSSISAIKRTFHGFIYNKYLFLHSKEPYNAL